MSEEFVAQLVILAGVGGCVHLEECTSETSVLKSGASLSLHQVIHQLPALSDINVNL